MKNFGVFTFESKEFLGDFLSITEGPIGPKVWYLSKGDGFIMSSFRENVIIKEITEPLEK